MHDDGVRATDLIHVRLTLREFSAAAKGDPRGVKTPESNRLAEAVRQSPKSPPGICGLPDGRGDIMDWAKQAWFLHLRGAH